MSYVQAKMEELTGKKSSKATLSRILKKIRLRLQKTPQVLSVQAKLLSFPRELKPKVILLDGFQTETASQWLAHAKKLMFSLYLMPATASQKRLSLHNRQISSSALRFLPRIM